MSRPTKTTPLDFATMKARAEEQAEARQYQGRNQTVEANRALVGEIVASMASNLAAAADETRRFDLSDLGRVSRVAIRYVQACAEAGTLPTVTGVAAALGRTRDALYKRGKTDRLFQEWLEAFSDQCGVAMAQAAINGAVAAVPAIFTLKSRHGWRDTYTIETPKETAQDTYEISTADLERFKALPAE